MVAPPSSSPTIAEMHMFLRITLLLTFVFCGSQLPAGELKLGVFDVDASPPIGSPMAYDPTKAIQSPLSCRGIVITGAGDPIVLCALDWIGVGNGGQTVFREQLAQAVGTQPDRVAVHALHQHDAPRCDFTAESIMADYGLPGIGFDPRFALDVVSRTADAAAASIQQAQPVTHLGTGEGLVKDVASNRRILGPDGTVKHMRFTATRDPDIRAFPAGTIDPQLKLISFWNGDEAVAALTYYATHPQSYYRTGLANPDFPGLARNARQQATAIPHIHFNGAGGNIGAGKWNDGSKENRQVLADKVAAGMKRAWDNTTKTPISADDVGWQSVPALLPLGDHLKAEPLMQLIQDETRKPLDRFYAAVDLAWVQRCTTGDPIDISCLTLGNSRILHLPGELFVEYQLNAQALRPDLFVAMAAYGDYAPGYIGTETAYSQGGYETSTRASRVAPQVEAVLMQAISTLLDVSEADATE